MSKAADVTLTSVKDLSDEKSRALPLKWWRRLAQVASLAVLGQWSFYGIFRCPFIVPYVSCQNCPVITCHGRLLTMFWGFWLIIPVSALIFGRAFCSWFCPGGLLNQLLGMMASAKLQIKNIFTKILPYFKYLGLAIALYAWLIYGQPRKAVPIRIGDFFASFAFTFKNASPLWLFRSLFVLGFIVLGLLLANAWCRFACPTGGVLEILKSFSLFKVYKDEKCDNCDKCLQVCEMGARPSEPNCTNCCDCRSVCPHDAIHIGRPRRKS
jgi:ferredoxin-type protein NapH